MTTKTVARRQVWKYALPPNSIDTDTVIKLPTDHKIIHVGFDPKDGSVALWIELPIISDDPAASLNGQNDLARKSWLSATDEVFRVIPTGADIPALLSDSGRVSEHWRWDGISPPPPNPAPVDSPGGRGYTHIGTAIDTSFGYVWHVYQILPIPR